MTSQDDPFLNVPEPRPAQQPAPEAPQGAAQSSATPPLPPPPPPASAGLAAAPPPVGQPVAPAAPGYPPQPDAAYAPAYGAGAYPYPPAGPRWKRSWGVTFGRTGIAAAVLFVLSFVTTLFFNVDSADSYAWGYVFGNVWGPVLMYVVLFGWWLDHVVARTGHWGSFAIHGGLGFVLAVVVTFSQIGAHARGTVDQTIVDAGVPPAMPMLIWFVGWPLAHFVASRLKGSFAPRATAPAYAPAPSTQPAP